MTQITVADLNNAKLDVDTIAAIANSTDPTVIDRLGNVRRTLYSITDSFIEQAPTFAAISDATNKRFVCVETDETNADEPTLYFFDGSELQWIPSVGV